MLFLNIGTDVDVYYKDIVAMVNIDKISGKINYEFIDSMMKKKFCVVLEKNVFRTAVILCKNGKSKIYISPLSVLALRKRLEAIYDSLLIKSKF